MRATNQEGSVRKPVALKVSSSEVAIIKLSSVTGDNAVKALDVTYKVFSIANMARVLGGELRALGG